MRNYIALQLVALLAMSTIVAAQDDAGGGDSADGEDSAEGGDSDDKGCETPTGFKTTECGSFETKLCCGAREACVEVEFNEEAHCALSECSPPSCMCKEAEAKQCSADRALFGSKIVKIVVVPLIGLLMTILAIAFMVLKLNIMNNNIVMLCMAQVLLAWPLFFSPSWHLSFYTIFLSLLVAGTSTYKQGSWWFYILVWFMLVFHLVAHFGAIESVHTPFYLWGGGAPTSGVTTLGDATEESCSTYYSGYFTKLGIERWAKDADSTLNYWGYCDFGWLAAVQTFSLLEGIALIVNICACIPILLSSGGVADASAAEFGRE